MNDFDRYLELELRKILDPVVDAGAPRRRRSGGAGLPFLAVVTAPIEMVAEVLPGLDPVAVPVPALQVLR